MTTFIIVALIFTVLVSALWIVGMNSEKEFDSHFAK